MRGSALPCNLTSLMNLSAVDFSVWLAFYFLECSGDFQLFSCQTGNWKVCDIFFFIPQTIDRNLELINFAVIGF